jgi:threonine/homoserine/homoserine lactone efflux protein
MEYFLKGVLAGLVIAVPLGPVAVLCFNRVLTERRLVGLASVLGAATADALYGLLAALGLRAVTHQLVVHHTFLKVVGGLLIIGLGVMILVSRPATAKRSSGSPGNLVGIFFSTMGLMLANVTVVLSLLAVFAALDLGEGSPGLDAAWVAAGVFVGSAAWWFVYRLIAARVGGKLEARTLRAIDRVSGSLICALGAWELISPLILRH